jgi:P4 family phage/plasmid primase-like protien
MTGKKMVYGRLTDGRFIYGLGGKHKKDIQAIYGDTRAIKKAVNDGITVYYVEGEKDVNTLKKHGYTAFTVGGVNDWSAAYVELVEGANVIVLADNDNPGKDLASRILHDVSKVAKTARIVIPMPDVEKADISDFFAEHSKQDFEKLLETSENEDNAAEQRSEVNLLKFHIVSEDGKIRRVNDFAVFDYLKHKYDILVIGGVVYIYQGGVFKADQSGARLKTIIRELIFPDLRKAPTINQIFNLFLQDIELETTLDQCNRQPRYWMNFENAYWNLKEQRFEEHNPKYRTLNQLPHKYEPDAGLHGEATDKFLGFVFEKDDNREMALEYACYCGTTDTTQQKFFCFCGIGGTGKSVFLALISKMVGESNISNIGMEELGQKFASFGLLNKLMNCCSELQIEALSDAKTLKQASGEDRIRCEQKGHDAVFERSIAKMIFSTNELPLIKNEKTDAVYRRMLVLPMNKKPDRQNPNLLSELETEIDYFIYLVVQAGQRLYARGTILESEDSKKAVEQLWRDSDTTKAFLDECCEVVTDKTAKVDRAVLYDKYDAFCRDSDRQALTKNNFYKSLRVKGFREMKSGSFRYFICLKLAQMDTKNCPNDFIDLTEGINIENPFI